MGTLTPAQFIAHHLGTRVFIPGAATAECVALFWAYNREVNQAEAYSAPGACNLWQQPGTTPYIWNTYDRIPTNAARGGEWGIWAGDRGAYPNAGYGHVAQFIGDNGNGTGQFFSQNPNAPAVITLSYDGLLGFLRPKNIPWDYNPTQPPAAGQLYGRTVTSPANVRTAPTTTAPLAPGYGTPLTVGTPLAVTGYVQGQDVTGHGDNAWYKTRSGFYVWANNAGNTIAGLPYLGKAA